MSFAGLALLACLLRPAWAVSSPRLDRRSAVQILDRLTFGPRPGDVEKLQTEGYDAWLDRQLRPETIDDSACEARLSGLATLKMTSGQLFDAFPLMAKRQKLGLPDGPPPRQILEELSAAKVTRAYCSERQLQEVMTDFWFNHFNVSWAKDSDKYLLTSYERDVIRPRVFGKFRDLLGAVAHSPAMLTYLDNFQSTIDERYAPLSSRQDIERMEDRMDRAAAARGGKGRKKLGLNENYARELMELHTLGVDGGYTQRDVTQLARVLTGWSVERPNPARGIADFRFVYRPRMHDPGTKVVLGQVFTTPAPRQGEQEGERALDLLARRPATARFLALKLCRRFVSDDPPPALVAKVAKRFHETGGDIRLTLRTLFTSKEFLDPLTFRAKVKTPFEFAISALRVTGAELRDPVKAARVVASMGEPLYLCEPPTGYPDKASAWVNSGALLSRMQLALQLFNDRPQAPAGADPRALLRGVPLDDGRAIVAKLVDDFLGGEISDRTMTAIERRLSDPEISGARLDDASPRYRLPRLAALVLGSPDFQRR